MRFPPSFIDEVKARLPVSEVVGRRVKLKRAGREFKGLSPFQQEKTPSFTVNDQKQFYHDFSTGKHGNIFDFVMETEGVSFPEAVERLAVMAGLPLPRSSREDEQREQRQKSLFEVMELAAKFFEQNLASRVGAQARGYLSDRAIAPSSVIEFRIGYATPDRFALKEYLGSKGVPVEDMIEAGLLIAGDDIPVPYDRFRDRIMIPIHDQRGRVVGFGGRALRKDAQPKYLNSPETPIFHKGSVVFNFHRARQPAHEANSVVAVEGYMDAIAVYQAGIKAVVATMGTAFTEEQIATLWRLSPEPVVCFDSDRAGVAAAYRSVDRILPLLRVGKTFRFVFMDEQKDPDDLIREKGVEAFRGVLSGSLPLWDVLWQRETDGRDIRTPDKQAALEQKLYTLVRTIQDPAVNTAFFRTSRMQLANLFWQVNRGPSRKNREAGSKFVRNELRIRGEDQRSGLQKVILGMLVEYPNLLEDKQDSVERLHFPEEFNGFLTSLFRLLVTDAKLSVADIWTKLKPEFYDTLQTVHGEAGDGKQRGHRLFERFPILSRDPPSDFVSGCLDHFIRILHWHELEDDIQRARLDAGEGDESAVARLLNLVREGHAEQEGISAEGVALSEWAEDIIRVWAPQGGTMRLAA
ncbi:DNA primase [Nitrobacter sp. Nb-311A]|uniref:DNA primase n=1 Tax=unclassified Nitrobacter TaxID=2620411 RepID=UPI00006870CC|nr:MULTISPECIES: DNA primase [unclassified Nitrobacter]EAQ35030.1 DNA primase [Nitrobacter sp. Nb-311A]MCB1393831.1 DNA primase [Nitrobacter sp.]MCV0387088.1 DNA primase [Nitrobacter sp.]